ncbi:MAG: homocysteine S-methyltransferase family protein, partial [Pseudomonadota bacterium]
MTDPLSKLLSMRDWLVADGATGTNLFAMGLEAGEAPELWNVDAPEKIRALYTGFIEAGSDLILTNSFGGTRARLKLHDAQDRALELNRIAAEIARECVDKTSRP